MILTVTAPNGRSVDVDTEENPHTCIIDGSFTCIACVAQSLVSQSDKAPAELLTDANLEAATWKVSEAQDGTWSVYHGDEYITGGWSTEQVAREDLLARTARSVTPEEEEDYFAGYKLLLGVEESDHGLLLNRRRCNSEMHYGTLGPEYHNGPSFKEAWVGYCGRETTNRIGVCDECITYWNDNYPQNPITANDNPPPAEENK